MALSLMDRQVKNKELHAALRAVLKLTQRKGAPCLARGLYATIDEVRGKKEWRRALSALQDDRTISGHCGKQMCLPFQGLTTSVEMLLQSTVVHLCRTLGTALDANRFDVFYEEFEAFFHGREFVVRVVVPVFGLSCESEVRVDPDVCLRQLELQEASEIRELVDPCQVGLLSSALLGLEFDREACALVLDVRQQKTFDGDLHRIAGRSHERVQTEVAAALQALRVLRRGRLSAPFMVTLPRGWSPADGKGMRLFTGINFGFGRYELN